MDDNIWQVLKSLDLALEREQELWTGDAEKGIVYAALTAVRNAINEVMDEHEN
jgi:hypothetical protein